MSGNELKLLLRGACWRVRVIDHRTGESLIDCHSRRHAREIAAFHVGRGRTAHIEPVLKLH